MDSVKAAMCLNAQQLFELLEQGRKEGSFNAGNWSFNGQTSISSRPGASLTSESGSKTYQIELSLAQDLNVHEEDAIVSLFTANMQALYELNDAKEGSLEGPGGWQPAEKRAELFHPQSRFLLLWLNDSTKAGSLPRTLVAFTMFRFDLEQCHPADPVIADRIRCDALPSSSSRKRSKMTAYKSIEVLYLYELQLHVQHRGTGLGAAIMRIVSGLATMIRMRKVCLTVFKDNVGAVRFYERLGWTKDMISPDDEDGVPWQIMSQGVREYGQ